MIDNVENLLKEWETLFAVNEEFYIYGAANTARKLLEVAKDTKVDNKVKGFLVSSKEGNPDIVEGLLVMDIHTFQDRNANILVPHSGVYKREIFSLLQQLGFSKIHHIHRFMHLFAKNEKKKIKDSCMDETMRRIRVKEERKNAQEKVEDEFLRKQIMQIRLEGKPDFGHAEFYQSLERIGIQGTRPSTYRVIKYGLEDILCKEQDVLDIGCNSGFLDISVADLVNSITGVEYEKALVTIANYVKEYLHMDNCTFIHSDFHDWYAENTRSFDVIFSFAIHHWLNLKPQDYVERLDKMLNINGYICLESHDLTNGLDNEYEKCIEALTALKYEVKNAGEIMDDGITPRKFIILRKTE